LTTAVIPGECTKYQTASHVAQNKQLKGYLHIIYGTWIAGQDDKEYTTGGNLKMPSFNLMLQLTKKARSNNSSEIVAKSFKVYGDRSGKPDTLVNCYNPKSFLLRLASKSKSKI